MSGYDLTNRQSVTRDEWFPGELSPTLPEEMDPELVAQDTQGNAALLEQVAPAPSSERRDAASAERSSVDEEPDWLAELELELAPDTPLPETPAPILAGSGGDPDQDEELPDVDEASDVDADVRDRVEPMQIEVEEIPWDIARMSDTGATLSAGPSSQELESAPACTAAEAERRLMERDHRFGFNRTTEPLNFGRGSISTRRSILRQIEEERQACTRERRGQDPVRPNPWPRIFGE